MIRAVEACGALDINQILQEYSRIPAGIPGGTLTAYKSDGGDIVNFFLKFSQKGVDVAKRYQI